MESGYYPERVVVGPRDACSGAKISRQLYHSERLLFGRIEAPVFDLGADPESPAETSAAAMEALWARVDRGSGRSAVRKAQRVRVTVRPLVRREALARRSQSKPG